MFASLGQTFLNIIAPLPEDDEDAENEEEEVLEAEEAKNLESKREEKEMNHSLSLSHQEPTMPTQSVKSLQKTQVAETNKSEKWKQCFELLEEATELVDVPLDEEDNIDTNDDASRAPMPSNTSESPSNTSELPSNPQILPPVSAHPPNKFEMVKTGNAESANETPPQLLIPPKVTSPSPLKPAAEKLLSPSHSSEDIGPLADPQSKDCSVLLDLEKALRDLQMSEEALREAEHISWQRKAEASELLFALELEQNSNAELKRTVHSLEQRVKDEVTQNESSPQAVVVVQPSMELSPIIQRLLRGLSVQSTSVDLGENLSLLEKNLNYLVERMETLEREVENWKEATSFRDHKISSLESDLLAVNTELSNSQMNGRASDTGAILKEYEAEIESLRSERERLLSTRETSSGPYALDVQRLEGQIKTLECTNNALLNELETKERLLKSHQEQASQRASECERLREAADVLKGLQSSKDAELLKVKRDLDDAQKVLAEQNVSLHQLKQQLQKSETEGKQLHQIIGQLRSARKTNREEEEGAAADREQLREQVKTLRRELEILQAEQYRRENELQLQSKHALEELSLQLEALLREKEGLEQRVYELTMETDNLRSDTMIAKRESLQKSSELSNLHVALAAFERDNALSQRKMNDVWQQRLEESERRAQARLEAEIAMWMEKLREQEKVAREAQQRAQSEEVLRRKQSLDLTSERSKMQRTLDAALTQLQNSREDVVDRALVANLVASYISKKRPKETLVLLSRILNFSDEQLVAVGLKVAPTTIVDSFLSILQPKLVPKQVSGENLAEQWVNFLLEESDQAGHTTGQTTKPSVEKVDSVEEVVGQTPKKAK